MMLHRMAFHLSDMMVALHLDNSTTKVYLCNKSSTLSPDKHSITLIPAYIPTHLNVEADHLS